MCATVCIVDDDEGMREVLARVARSIGLDAELYDSAEAFLRRVDRIGITCMMLDVQLGGMSGLGLLARLCEEQHTFPVFLISGTHDAGTVSHARRLGAIVIDKPFDARMLGRRILATIGAAPPETAS